MLRRLAIIIWATASLAACDRLPGRSAEPAASPRGMPDFGGVEVVEVTADGVGPTRNAAILDALNLVVRKTTGTPIEGLSVNLNGSFVINGQAGDAGLTLDAVAAMTRGAVRSFEIVEEREKREPAWRSMFGREEVKREPSSWRVTVKAKVAKFKDTAAFDTERLFSSYVLHEKNEDEQKEYDAKKAHSRPTGFGKDDYIPLAVLKPRAVRASICFS